MARVAPPMRGNDRYGLYYWGKGRCGSPHAGMTPTDYRPQARSDPSVMPPGPCPSRRAPLSCRRPPLSFPPVVSGNPVSFSSIPSFVWLCMGKAMDSRLTMSGMTAGD